MNLNQILRPIDRKIYQVLPSFNALTSVNDVSAALFDIMLGAHMLAVHNCQQARQTRRAGYIEMSDREIKKLLKNASASDRDALRKFYGSISRSVSSKAMSKVRSEMLKSTLESVRDTGKEESALKKAIGRPKVGRDSPVLETVFRTQAALAYEAAAWVENNQDDDLWGYEYTTAGDERVRSSHEDLDGIRYPKTHEFWRKYAPINGWNCRCALVPIYFGDKNARIKPFKGTPDVDPAFRVNFGMLFQIAA